MSRKQRQFSYWSALDSAFSRWFRTNPSTSYGQSLYLLSPVWRLSIRQRISPGIKLKRGDRYRRWRLIRD
jgi:hypothetical protein